MSAETKGATSYRVWSACDRTAIGVGNNSVWTDKASRAFTGVLIRHLQTVRCAVTKRGEELRYTPLSFWYSCSNPLMEAN